jgi:hypothetical protein
VTKLPNGDEDCGKPLVQGGGPAATGAVAASRRGRTGLPRLDEVESFLEAQPDAARAKVLSGV